MSAFRPSPDLKGSANAAGEFHPPEAARPVREEDFNPQDGYYL
jgi:hypothetical protein